MQSIQYMLKRIKSFFQSTQERKRTYPPKFQANQWSKASRRNGLHGDRNKLIKRVRNGREKTASIPYQPEIFMAFKEHMRMPSWDETQGGDKPDATTLEQYDPGRIKW